MTRFLASKQSVDDRALNKDVVERLRKELRSSSETLHVLEIGAGLGTMIGRMADWGLLAECKYTLLDVDSGLLEDSREWLSDWAKRTGRRVRALGSALVLEGADGSRIEVSFMEAELGKFLEQSKTGTADLLVANAFLDLVDVPAMLPDLFRLLKDTGLFWFSINFDGQTIFQPAHPHDETFMEVYHRSMDERVRYGRPAGNSRTGRLLFGHLAAQGADVLAAGSSDWVVFPRHGSYPDQEAHFLHHILNTVEQELAHHEEIRGDQLAEWGRTRHAQVERGELVYLAHQLDFLGRIDSTVRG